MMDSRTPAVIGRFSHSFGKRNFSSGVRSHLLGVRTLPIMTPILAKVTAIEERGDQYQVIVQINPKYRGPLNSLGRQATE
jgi:hypothetical protein